MAGLFVCLFSRQPSSSCETLKTFQIFFVNHFFMQVLDVRTQVQWKERLAPSITVRIRTRVFHLNSSALVAFPVVCRGPELGPLSLLPGLWPYSSACAS